MEILYKRNINSKDNLKETLTIGLIVAGATGSIFAFSDKRKLII